jgi:hypothetical protein
MVVLNIINEETKIIHKTKVSKMLDGLSNWINDRVELYILISLKYPDQKC